MLASAPAGKESAVRASLMLDMVAALNPDACELVGETQ